MLMRERGRKTKRCAEVIEGSPNVTQNHNRSCCWTRHDVVTEDQREAEYVSSRVRQMKARALPLPFLSSPLLDALTLPRPALLGPYPFIV